MNKPNVTPVTIIIAGDLAPTPSNYSFFIRGDISGIVDRKILDIFSSADFRLFNLEVPLTDDVNPIAKDGPSLKAPASAINGIKQLDPSVMTLANNHIMDQGEEGLLSTMKLLSDNMIACVGAGRDIKEASDSIALDKNGLKIAVYACTEHEFSIAGENSAGANPLDLYDGFDHISGLKSGSNYVIVLLHGGKEHYRYPTPDLQKTCRKMVKSGADLVVCQHSHCIGSYEQYGDGIIVYGQGNFLFDRHDNEYWSTGLLVRAVFGEKMDVEFIPFNKKGKGVELSDTHTGESILSDFFVRSEQITSTPDFVMKQFEKYALENGQYYLATLAGLGKTLRRLDKFLNRPLTRLIYSRKNINTIRNHFECETHRELIIKYLQLMAGTK
jgi:poly-gamma-glutamate synthesis protein (capsule biosynthesis protein)